MHKLKSKHTGEVITTPYLTEVEEYLNSGDYEMITDVKIYKGYHQESTRMLCKHNEFLVEHEFEVIGDSAVGAAIKLIEDAYIAKDGDSLNVGDKVKYPSGEGKLLISEPDENGIVIVLDDFQNRYKRVSLSAIKPIQTIEDDLCWFYKFLKNL